MAGRRVTGQGRARQAAEASGKEPAEGSRETVREAASRSRSAEATGITSAPRERERASQRAVPPRGERKAAGRSGAARRSRRRRP